MVSRRLIGVPQPKSGSKKKKLPSISSLKNKLVKVSHDYIRKRDSKEEYEIAGYCFDCGEWAVGQYFQAGHFLPDGGSGAVLRYHPDNMHGQSAGCNMKHQQERVKINYTIKMIDKYGRDYVDFLRHLRQKSIKADRFFYERMISLYQLGDEDEIVKYLESLVV